jgi:SAM-dependent methyltransferase
MTRNRKLEAENEIGKSYRRGALSLVVAVLGHLLGIYVLIVPGVLTLQRQDIDREHVAYAEQRDSSPYMAPFVPTPQEVVDRMLELAQIGRGDVLYDLGSGDGRIVVSAAARYGVRAVGFEIDPNLVKESREAIRAAGLGHLAEIHEQDIRTVDFSPASVVTMYLYPGANLRLRSAILRQLKPGSRVVSHDFGMGDWKPDRVERITDSMGLLRTIYLWRIREPST